MLADQSRTNRGLLREIGGSGVQGITGRAPCAAAARDVVGTASRRGLLLGDWWREAQGPAGRLPCGVAVRLMSRCARIISGCRKAIVELGARPHGVMSAPPDGHFRHRSANVADRPWFAPGDWWFGSARNHKACALCGYGP